MEKTSKSTWRGDAIRRRVFVSSCSPEIFQLWMISRSDNGIQSSRNVVPKYVFDILKQCQRILITMVMFSNCNPFNAAESVLLKITIQAFLKKNDY